MKNSRLTSIILAFLLFSLCAAFTNDGQENSIATIPFHPDKDLVKRGEYLVGVLGCQDCHSPKRMGAQGPEVIPELHLSGYPASRPIARIFPEAIQGGWMLFGADGTSAVGPWGMSFAANLTSDETGIGSWSYDQFKTALTKGKFKGLANTRPLLPPMPWTNYTNMAEEDIQAVFQYLKSTKPVSNVVPSPITPDKLK
jgi:mono/diheme cytochrome c family protein